MKKEERNSYEKEMDRRLKLLKENKTELFSWQEVKEHIQKIRKNHMGNRD